MKRTAVLYAVLMLTHTAIAQAVDRAHTEPTNRLLGNLSMPKDDEAEDVQRNFVVQNWRKGTVTFRGAAAKAVYPLIFDVYSNQLYFLRDSVIMEFTQPIQEFTIAVLAKGDTTYKRYKCGYPPIHRNTAETFYEVLTEGPFQLLRCKAKTIALYKDVDVPEQERDYSKELYYALLPDGNIVLVKRDKEYLLQTLPKHAADIEKICTDQKLKLKNEAQLIRLFEELGKRKEG